MKLLLDTHTLLWVLHKPEQLSTRARQVLSMPESELYVSIASLWEITIKVAIGKMSLSGASLDEVFERVRASRVRILPIETAHLLQLRLLPRLHKDPFDRILIAQSRAEQRPLVTVDRDIQRYDVQTIW